MDYSIDVSLDVGSIVDFAIGPYTGNAEQSYGTTNFSAIIRGYFIPIHPIGGGVFDDPNGSELSNCILWNNSSSGDMNEHAQFYGGVPIVNYSCIQGLTGDLGGLGNIGVDTCFAAPENGDYQLLPNSPCIDAGDPNYSGDAHDVDIDGDARIIGGRIDIGADEYHYAELCDLYKDGIVDFKDFAILVYYWMDYICVGPDWCEGSDFDHSRAVDSNDLGMLAEAWLWQRPKPRLPL